MEYDKLIKHAETNFPDEEKLAMDEKMFELRLIDMEAYAYALVTKEFLPFLKSLKDKDIKTEIMAKLKVIDKEWEELAKPVEDCITSGDDFATLVINEKFKLEEYKKVCMCRVWTEFLIQTLKFLEIDKIENHNGMQPMQNTLN